MADGLLIYAVIITALLIFILILFILYKKQIHVLTKKLRFIQERNTHIQLTADLPTEYIGELVNSINELLEANQNYISRMEQHELTVKETITNISHDLRTPLTAIRGYTQMLLTSKRMSTEEIETIKIINDKAKVLESLLSQLFIFARLDAEEIELNLENVDINKVLRSSLTSFFQEFDEKGIEPVLSIPEVPFIICGDINALSRVFSNILSNALIHGKGNYRILSSRENKNYMIQFQNQTSDIEFDDLERIFDRFYTTDKSRSRKTTGLGLAIARRLVEKMGGTIRAELYNDVFSIVIQFPIVLCQIQ